MNDSMNMTKAFNGGIDKLESFDFRGREILHKNVEIFAVGKIAEFARFAGGERRKSPDLVSDKQAARGSGMFYIFWSKAGILST